MSTTASITVSIADGIASVEIDNPAQRNALTRAMCLELQDVMPRLDADSDVFAVTLRGNGDVFCAGAALSELRSVLLDPQADGSLVDQLSRADAAIATVAKPTIALVDGACRGGGWQIASACDFVMASERSTFAITPAKLGIIYPRPGVERLVRLVGPAVAKYVLFTGQVFTAARAQELGLIAEATPAGQFEVRTDAILGSIRDNSRFTTHTLKHLIDLGPAESADVDRAWTDAWTSMTASPDMEIGVGAFLGRALPRFSWRP